MRLEPFFTLEELQQVAFQRERTAARQRTRTTGQAPRDALESVLTSSAGGTTLAALVAKRKAENQAQADRRAARGHASAARFAAKRARRDGACLHGEHPAASATEADGQGQSGGCTTGPAWQAWFDGSALPNPGRIGIGAVLVSPKGVRTEISARAGNGDNNRAEYLALIAVLEQAVDCGVQRLIVHGDSRVVFGDIDATAPVRTDELIACRKAALGLMSQIPAVRLQWIPRARNADADRLARAPQESAAVT